MSKENKNESHRGFTMVIAVAIAIPVLYVLSVGPAIAICKKYPKCDVPALENFYYPIGWLDDNTPLHEPLDFYIGLWVH